MFTCATPEIPFSALVIVGSAIRVSCAGVYASDASVSDTIGRSAGSNRLRIGSFISTGRSIRMDEIASRMSWVACEMSFSNTNTTTICA
jgi:hypothetical protein